ncbi:hypothetical protein [Mycetocola reblochoni]|uniref:Integral membrane protein n=2 Tax=Mycetocola reblochoni TaxID=331618 RepID=A0A1R4K1Z5_9MICO|nr:hypothetical protein [Mycetocola reblochoni]RLP70435.1 hypothetical protein D9V30_02705 [Mycetocola reblochoni]SJN38194.1 hypothetical protein FM119_10880 [Mycetocola reblochoni REB411]
MTTTTPGAWKLPVLTAILLAEALVMTAIVLWLIVDLVTLTPSSYATAVAITVLAAIGAAFVWAIALMCLRRRARFRGGAVVWQLIQIAVAVGSFQGAFAQPLIGWVILLPSLAALILCFSAPVTRLVTAEQ